MTSTNRTATDAARELNASDPKWRVWLIHRHTFHWTSDYRSTLCGISFNSRGYTEPSHVGSSDRVCPVCSEATR